MSTLNGRLAALERQHDLGDGEPDFQALADRYGLDPEEVRFHWHEHQEHIRRYGRQDPAQLIKELAERYELDEHGLWDEYRALLSECEP